MTFEEMLQQTIEILRNRGRMSYRALKRQFDIDDAYLEDLKEEILYAYPQVTEEEGRGLVWTAADTTMSVPTPVPVQPAQATATPERSATKEPSPTAAPSAPEAERRQLTVMFCDLAASTQLSQQLDPEDLREVIRAYQETAVAVVQRFGGYAAQYLGDGLLLYFGWPQAHEDDAQRGVRAGLGIVETLTTTLNTRLEREHGVRLAVRIGLHTGPVVVGEMGGGGRHEQLALGETTNIAARLEGLAAPNTVVLSKITARLVAGFFALDDLGLHELRGVAEPMQVFGVVQEYTVAEREAAAEAAGATILVGRDAELALLMERWTQSKDGRGQVVLVSGEGGIGKSRLVEAVRTRVRREGSARITFRCSPYYQSSALTPVITHLEQLLQFHREDTPEGKFAKLERVLGAYRFPRADTLPLFATLFSLPLPAHVPPSRLTPEQQKQHTQQDLISWLMEEAEQQPLLVVWEDVQWIDPSSLEVLSLLLDQVPTVPMLTVVVCRPEFPSPWGMRSHLTPIALGNLGRAHVEAIATHVTGGKTLPAGLITQIAEKTDGVPLFVEEMTKAIVESGVLRDAGDHYELTGPVEAVRIPMTLHDALMARLDRLHTAKSLAQLGAVIGRRFSYDLVKALTAYDEGRLQQELGQLVEAELLYQRGVPPRTTYMFKHALIQDVAYESLLRRRRQVLHGAIGEAIEALEGARAAEQAGILAYHYARSLHQDKAVTYALLAGDEAVRLHARTEATTAYDQALTLARGLSDTPEARCMQIDAILKLAAVSRSRADLARDQANLEQAQALAETLADEPRLAQVRYWQGRLAYVRGDLQTAITYAEQSLAIADRMAQETLSAPPVNLLGRSYTMRWDVARGSQLLARSTAQMHQIGNRIEEATAAGFAAAAFGWRGEFTQALAYADRGVALAQELTNPFAEAAALQYRGNVYEQQGAWTHALADFAARRVAEGVGDHFRVYVVNLFKGWTSTRAGDPVAGRVLLEQALTFAEQIGTVFFVALGKAWLAACSLALGELDIVPALCQEALRVAEETSDRFAQAVAHRALAEALTLGTAPDRQQAEQAMGEAIQLWKEIEFNPELARTYVSYARLLQRWGQARQARAYLAEAIAMFQEIGMDWDLAQAEQMLAS
jgi:class 3 adenylate cyclase/tetratricopeptide (TPR) repeat protein